MGKSRIFTKDVLKFGVEAIIAKNPESDIAYNVDELQKVLQKAIDLVDIYK